MQFFLTNLVVSKGGDHCIFTLSFFKGMIYLVFELFLNENILQYTLILLFFCKSYVGHVFSTPELLFVSETN